MDRNVAPSVSRAPLELWHLPDGRVLLHQHGRGAQAWIEVQPEAVPWLIDQLQASKERGEHEQGNT